MSSRNTNPRTPVKPSARSTQPGIRSKTPVTESRTIARGTGPKPSFSSSNLKSRFVDDAPKPPTPKPLSIKEAIALKRNQAKQGKTKPKPDETDENGVAGDEGLLEDGDELGRQSIRVTIERARSTGNLNLSARALPCIPNCLFEIHLGVKPSPLKLVPEAEADPGATPSELRRLAKSRAAPISWFEAQDLQILKARNNEIVELQPELSLFGSLKVIDLQHNALSTLPPTVTSLSSLTNLDLSFNKITSFPAPLFSLPSLAVVNLSNNLLTGLPFSRFDEPYDSSQVKQTDDFFSPPVQRASTPLPCLHTLDLSNNQLDSSLVDCDYIPNGIITLTLSHNPLACTPNLIAALAKLPKLRSLILEGADVSDDAFPASAPPKSFPALQILDLSSTKVTDGSLRAFFSGTVREAQLNFNSAVSEGGSDGELKVLVGKRVLREAWEIETERSHSRRRGAQRSSDESVETKSAGPVVKEAWEVKAEQGLLTEGGRRRARAAATSPTLHPDKTSGPPSLPSPTEPEPSRRLEKAPKKPEKEAWEVEAELGLLTEGARRRARAQAQLEAETATPTPCDVQPSLGLAAPTYYTATTQTLTLPPSYPPPRQHGRAFSLAVSPASLASRKKEDFAVPTPTLPLSVICGQSFNATLRVLVLSNRKADPSFVIPEFDTENNEPLLPALEEFSLEGCGLGDQVNVHISSALDRPHATPPKREMILPRVASLFPGLRVLNLSYNGLTDAAFTMDTLQSLLFPAMLPSSDSQGHQRKGKGLRILRLRGNAISTLAGFEQLASLFKGNRQVPGWELEELDLQDNAISKLPAMVGLLPLDVLLVDGNTFRIPARKVWEREGTKGLLSWLRGRID